MYRVEIYDMYTQTFVDAFPIDHSTPISYDYINPQTFEVTAPADVTVSLRNTVRILDEGTVLYSGYVSDITRERTKTVISLAPLMLLLNEVSVQNTTYTDWRHQIEQQIWYDFRQTTPSLYAVPWTYYTSLPYTNWDGVTATYGAELLNDMECVQLAATTYGKFMTFGVAVSSTNFGKPVYGFRKFTTTQTIEADLDNIIEKDIQETRLGGYNIAMLWYPYSQGNYQHYDAVLLNGTVQSATAALKAQIAEPRIASRVTDNSSPTNEEIWQFFRQALQPSADNLDITLTVLKDDKIIEPTKMLIGQPVLIKANGKEYSTFLTGFTIYRDRYDLKFGTIRQALTAQLNREDK